MAHHLPRNEETMEDMFTRWMKSYTDKLDPLSRMRLKKNIRKWLEQFDG